jgi:hypothetical protein
MSVQTLRRSIDALKSRARRRASDRARSRMHLRSPKVLQRVESAENSAAVVAETLRALSDSLTGLHPFRRLSQGGWIVGLDGTECVAPSGRRPRFSRSRIEVCVSVHELDGVVRFVCRRTVLDRDLDALQCEIPLASASGSALTEWIEGACLEFAAALLARRATLDCVQLTA